MKKHLFGLLAFALLSFSSKAQVVVTATGGSPIAAYGTLGAAFAAVNAGTHSGDIVIQIAANTTEAGSCVLNSGDATPASYNSILIQAGADNVTVSGAPATGRGLIELNGADNVTIDGDNPGTGGTNQNLTLTNTAAAATQFTSVIRLVTGTGVTSANNNTIKNLNINGSGVGLNNSGQTTGAVANTMGIYGGGGASGATAAPAALAAVNTTGATMNNLLIDNNRITNAARGISINGTDATSINILSITNNVVGTAGVLAGNPPYATPASTIYVVGITVKGAATLNMNGNTIQNVMSYATQPIRGLEIVGVITTANVNNNTVNGVIANTASASGDEGMFIGSVTGACNIVGNTITNVQSLTGSAAISRGINLQVTATVDKNNISKVYNRNTGTWGSFGIDVLGGNNSLFTNNFISDINYDITGSSAFNSTLGTAGLRLGAGTGHKVYNNSINMFGALLGSSGSTVGSGCIQIYTGITGCDIRNNILSNTMTNGTSVENTCLLLPSGPTSALNLTLNNNAYYTGSITTSQSLAFVGTTTGTAANRYLAANFNNATTTPATNWRSVSATLNSAGTNDNSSFATTAAAPFVSPTNLHIPAGTATPAESGGASVGVVNDIDGQTRPGPAGSINGGGTAPDMGADEFDGVPVDIFPPSITYTSLISTCSTGDRTLTATIADATSVNAGAFKPRIYYKKNSGAWFSQPGILTTGTSISGTWTFTILNSDLGGVAVGDVVSYFVIAQDVNSPTPNISANPGAGLVATNVNTITTYPTTPNTYLIQNTLAGGTYTVGGGGTYSTLTAAVNVYNTSCLTGAVTFVLTDAAYTGPGETFPITINANGFASVANTLTIRPAAGVAATITSGAASTAVLKLLNASFVTIDGLNTGGSSLTLNNSNTGTSAGIWLASTAAVGPGSNNINIKNLTINGGSSTQVNDWGILAGVDGATPSGTAGFNIDNITVQGNTFLKSGYGIYANGTAAVSAGGLDNWNIGNNTFGPAATGANNIGVNGMFLQNMVNPTIANNNIRNIGSNTATVQTVGITLASNVTGAVIQNNIINNVVSNATTSSTSSVAALLIGTNVINTLVSKNTITGVTSTATGGYGARAVIINTGTNTSNLTIVNNIIADVSTYGDASNIYWGIGIDIDGTSGGVNVYYNSINLYGSHVGLTSATVAACIFVNTTGTAIDIRNNILSNSYDNTTSSVDKSYAIYSVAANTSFSAIDYNDYYVSGPSGVLAFIGSDRTTLPALVAGFGGNANSLNIAPVFVAPNNTRLQPVAGNSLLVSATPIGSVTTDIDGTNRSPLHPTIGVNEIVADPILSGPGILCTGGNTATINYTGASNATTYSIAWSTAATGVGFANVTNRTLTPGSITVAAPPTAPAAVYTGTLTVSNGTISSPGTPISIQINQAPSLTSATNSGPVCVGGTFNLYANGAANVTSSLWSGPSAVTGPTFPLAFVSGATLASAGTYSITVNNGTGSGCAVVYTTSVVVNPLPNVSSFTATANPTCINTNNSVAVSSSLIDGVYTVTYNLSGANTATGATGRLTMLGGNGTFNTRTLNTAGSTTITVTSVTNSFGCSSTLSTGNTASFNVNPLPTVYNVVFPGADHYCAGSTGVHIGLDGSDFGVNYQLFIGSTPVSAVIGGTGGAIDFGTFTAAVSYTARATNAGTFCSANMAGSATVVIDPLPTPFAVTGGGNYCSGGTGMSVGLANSEIGVNYILYYGSTPGASMAGTGGAIDFGLQTAAGSYSVLGFNATTLCSNNMSGSVAVGINPLPVPYTVTGGGAYCSGGSGFHISLSASNVGVDYTLYNGSTPVSTQSGVGASLDFGAQTDAGVYTINAINTTTLCEGPMGNSVTIVVNSLPATHAVIGGGAYCSGGTGAEVKLDGSDLGIRYQLYNGATTVGGMMDGTGDTVNFGLQTLGGSFTVVATDTTTHCTSNMTGGATVMVNPLPTPFTVTGGGAYCASSTGVHVGLNGSNIGTSYQLYNRTAMVGGVVAGSGAPLDFGILTDTGSYTVTAMNDTTGCNRNMTGAVAISINPLPTVYTVTGGGNACATGTGVSIGLSGSQVGVNYRLFLGSTAIGTSMAGTGSALDFGLHTAGGTYTVVATDATTSCTSNMAASGTITVIAAPAAFNVIGGGHYCTGSTGRDVSLDGSVVGVNYQLYQGTTAIGSPVAGTGDTISFGIQTITGAYTVVATNAVPVSCSSNMTGSVTVTEVNLVTPSVTLSSTPGTSVCQGTAVSFGVTPVHGGTAPVYQWTVNGAAVTTTGGTYSYTPVNADVVAVTLRSNEECATPDTAISSVLLTVTTNQLPTVAVMAHPGTQICQGATVNYTDTVTYGGTAPTFTWLVNGSIVGTGRSFSYVPGNGDVVSEVLNSNYTCRLATTVYSNDLVMNVAPPIVPSVTIVEKPGPMVAPGKSDTLTAVVLNGGANTLYQWTVNGGVVPGATNATFIRSSFLNHDSVSVRVTRNDACGLSTFNSVIISVGLLNVTNVTANSDIHVVPNPNKGEFTVKGSLGVANDAEVSLEITDVLGQVIYRNKVIAQNGNINERVKMGNVANGMYLLNLRSDAGSQVFHIVLEQ